MTDPTSNAATPRVDAANWNNIWDVARQLETALTAAEARLDAATEVVRGLVRAWDVGEEDAFCKRAMPAARSFLSSGTDTGREQGKDLADAQE